MVIGGGLTAIDTATELMAYYPLQVEKVLEQYEGLCRVDRRSARAGASTTPRSSSSWTSSVRTGPRFGPSAARAAAAGEAPDFVPLVRSWGGVTLAYRKRMVDSPAYRLNHEEVIKALEEGITFAENLNPLEAVPDERGAVAAMRFTREAGRPAEVGRVLGPGDHRGDAPGAHGARGRGHVAQHHLRARGAGTFQLDAKKKFFQPHSGVAGRRRAVPPDARCRRLLHVARAATAVSSPTTATTIRATPATSSRRWRRRRTGYPKVVELFDAGPARAGSGGTAGTGCTSGARWSPRLDEELIATVEDVVRLTPTIVEVIVKAPAAARHFHPGQFYRLQNYESLARRVGGVPLLMEGIALTGAWVDKEKGLLSLIALELGVSSRLVAYLQKGERVVVMGPTGAPTEIPGRPERAPARAAVSATPCCSRSRRRCASTATG